MIRDECNEIQTIIEGSKKIEILIDDDDINVEEKNDDIERDQFPPNKQWKDFFESLSQPNFQPLSDKKR